MVSARQGLKSVLTSAHNALIKRLIRLLGSSQARHQENVFVIEGVHLCQMCLERSIPIEQIFVNQRWGCVPEIQAVLTQARSVPTWYCSPELSTRLSSLKSPPKIWAVCARPIVPARVESGACILLDSLQDPGNVGALLRSAAATGVKQVYLNASCVDVYAPKVLRSAMGAHFSLVLHEEADLVKVLQSFPGLKLVTSLQGTTSLYQHDLRGPVAFVFGSEGAGVSSALQAMADVQVRIPMLGCMESLNVAMAATVCLFERMRQSEDRRQGTEVRRGNHAGA